MGIRKTIAAIIAAAMVLSMTACADNEKTNNEGVATNSNSSSTNKVFGIEDDVPEPPKQTSMWDVIPEIPVTDASAFKYRYSSELEGMVITDYLKESPKVRIPSTLEGEPVVGIDWGRTDQNYTITELIFPDTMKEIDIDRVKGLKYMNFPYIFSLESDYGLSFLYTTRKPTLSIAYIDEGVKAIGNSFQDCEELTTISIPNSITAISARAFDGCPNLAEVYYKGKKYDGLTEELIDIINSNSNGGFIVEDGVLECCYGSGDLVIPKNVTTINSDTKFLNRISSLTIPDSVTEIGDGAFKDYTGLTSVTIGNGVTEIGDSVFSGCTRLTSVTIGNGVTEIGREAFKGCTSLTSVIIPDSVIKADETAFEDLTSAVITYKGKTYNYENWKELYIAINWHEGSVIMPNLIGMTLNEIETSNYGITVVAQEQWSEYPEGKIFEQEFSVGEKVRRGSRVRVTVSKGVEKVEVGDYSNQIAASAKAQLEEDGFNVSIVYKYSNDIPDGYVIRTSPSAHEMADLGSTIVLDVSSGDTVPVKYTFPADANGEFVFKYYIDGVIDEMLTETREVGLAEGIMWRVNVNPGEIKEFAIKVTSVKTRLTNTFVEFSIDFSSGSEPKVIQKYLDNDVFT